MELDRAWADLTLHSLLRQRDLPKRERAFATELAYGALRTRGRLDCALRQVLDRDLDGLEPGLRNLLRLGAYQLLVLEGVRDATAVDETVKLGRAAGFARASGFINAVLRQLANRRESLVYPELESDPIDCVRDRGSLPQWLAERWVEELGPKAALELAEVSQSPPPRTVRLSPGTDKRAVVSRLGGRSCQYAPDGLTGLVSDPVQDPGFARGEFNIQDEASQLVALLVDAQEGDTVVDCCAAPGGKAVQLAQTVGPRGEVIALELHERRLGLIRRERDRLGLKNLRILARDVAKGFDLQGRLWFSRILVDAPCSGLGVLRRNPDARWNARAEEVQRLADTGLSILESAARYVEDGGVLVYSVCTVTPEETHGVIQRFRESHPEFEIDDARPFLPEAAAGLVELAGPTPGALRTWPHLHGCDGFYAVRLRKQPK
ncbi:MAG: 16S rRNA (cytosine(967)-C(5))-methyltransferase RsmB [Deltaproteobacteria bacterium]|nr:16S rRNA (cytosine(967)-C(5))-methyltransferase RsmB [Deltaproteobacteria bacterium]